MLCLYFVGSAMKSRLSLVVLALLSVSSQAMAQIPPTAFKGVTKLVRKGKEQYSPTLGAVALSSLIPDLRFNGDFIPAYDSNEGRNFINDQSEDSHWNVVKILFPSPTGTLSSETAGKTNFGKYVQDPKVVSELINFAHQIRQDLQKASKPNVKASSNTKELKEAKDRLKELNGKEKKSPQEVQEAKDLPNKIRLLKKQAKPKTQPIDPVTTYTPIIQKLMKSSDSKDSVLESDKIRDLLKFIKEAIGNESKQSSLYPEGTAEQIILAFFVHKFNSETDILKLYEGYDNELVDHGKLKQTKLTPLTKEDIDQLRKQPIDNPYSLDDLYDLSKAETFDSPLPYDETQPLLNNGKAKKFDRNTKTFKTDTFADCAETVVRHILNLSFYDANYRDFSDIDSDLQPMEGVREFFQKQTFEQASAGDLSYRSAFNALVAGLNEGHQGTDMPIKYVKQDNNELETGLLNLTRVLSRVLGVKVEEVQMDTSDESKWVNSKKQWIQENLEKILNTSTNGKKHTVKVETAELWEKLQDLTGRVHVSVSSLTNQLLYSYTIVSSTGHIAIEGLKTPSQKSETLTMHAGPPLKGSSQDSIWMLMPEFDQFKSIPFLYQLLITPIVDNQSRINFVKTLVDHFKDDVFQKNLDTIKRMLKNVLHEFSWNDDEMVKFISPPILDLLERDPQFFKGGVGKEIKSLNIAFKSNLERQLLDSSIKLERLVISANQRGKTYSLEAHEGIMNSVKVLSLTNTDLGDLTGFEHAPNLEELDLSSNRKLKVLDISGAKNLKKLSLDFSDIEVITGFNHATRLEELNLNQTEELKTLDVSGAKNLRKLSLAYSAIQEVKGLGDLNSLEHLNLLGTEELEELDVKRLKSLKTLNLKKSKIKRLEGLTHVPEIEQIDLEETKKLKNLDVGGKHLKIMNLKKSGVMHLAFSADLPSLETIDLEHSNVKTISGLNHARNLKELKLQRTAIDQLNVAGLGNLEQLWLQHSKITSLTGLKDAKNLNRLYTYGTQKLKTLDLEGVTQSLEISSENLHSIYAGKSSLDNIEIRGGDEDITVKYVGKTRPKLKFKTSGSGKLRYEEVNE